MFRKIVVAFNESPESERALISAIRLTKSLNAELQTITFMADFPRTPPSPAWPIPGSHWFSNKTS